MGLISIVVLFLVLIMSVVAVLMSSSPRRTAENRRYSTQETVNTSATETKRCGQPQKLPIAVNYHFSRQCNYSCGFCFFTAKTSHRAELSDAKLGLKMMRDAGMKKINFAGGEPFLHPKFLGCLLQFCKEDLQLESVSIVSNGSKITETFLRQHGKNIDILAISCDSFNEQINKDIGRGTGTHVEKLYEIAGWCRKHSIMFKMNTVVCKPNWEEDMNSHIEALQPFRWKCFQVLMVPDENDSEETLRDVRKFQISNAEFESFCKRHERQTCIVPESNRVMAESYLILDEYMRFLDRTGKTASKPILEVGVQAALDSVAWDEEAFAERGGQYA